MSIISEKYKYYVKYYISKSSLQPLEHEYAQIIQAHTLTGSQAMSNMAVVCRNLVIKIIANIYQNHNK
jgi:hypothetical protein